MARPTKFNPDMIERVIELTATGATESKVAQDLGISISTLTEWKQTNPEFLVSLKAGKGLADSRVQMSLYDRAIGFTGPDGVYVPPHPTAQIFWLKNRMRDEWRDVVRNEISGPDGAPLNAVNMTPEQSADLSAYIAGIRAKIGAECESKGLKPLGG